MTDQLGRGKVFDGHRDPRSAKGVERRREIRTEDAVEVKDVTANLIAGLRREPIGAEIVAAELIARTLVKIRRAGERGRDDAGDRELLSRLMMTTPFGMVAAPPPVQLQHGREVAEAYARHDAERGRDASREPWVSDLVTDGATAPDEVSSNAG